MAVGVSAGGRGLAKLVSCQSLTVCFKHNMIRSGIVHFGNIQPASTSDSAL